MPPPSLLDLYDVSLDFLTGVVVANPSLRGMLLGYIAEAKLRQVLEGHGRATAFRKDDDHDRKKKGDLVVTYQGVEFKIEVKSLQTHTVEILDPAVAGTETWVRKQLRQKGPGKPNPAYAPVWEAHRLETRFRGQVQCDASDRREVEFPDGSAVQTTNLLFGEFHILAAGLFAFREKWDFIFALNRDLPASPSGAYTQAQRESLIDGMIPVTWPPVAPFVGDIYTLLDRLVAEETAKRAGKPAPETQVVEEAPPARTTEVVEEQRLNVVRRKPKKKP